MDTRKINSLAEILRKAFGDDPDVRRDVFVRLTAVQAQDDEQLDALAAVEAAIAKSRIE